MLVGLKNNCKGIHYVTNASVHLITLYKCRLIPIQVVHIYLSGRDNVTLIRHEVVKLFLSISISKMHTVRFTAEGKFAGRGDTLMSRDEKPPKLPSAESFKLANIINHLDNSAEIRQQIVDSILEINANYTKDVDSQVGTIKKIEKEEIYDKLENIRTSYESLKKSLPNEQERRKRVMGQIKEDLGDINDQLVEASQRMERYLGQLKSFESKVPLKDRLLDLRSPNRDQYQTLFLYSMREEIERENERRKKEKDEEARIIEEERAKLKIQGFHYNEGKNNIGCDIKAKDSISASPVKMRQYLSVENDLNEVQNNKSSGFSNPIRLISNESPVVGVSNEVVSGNTTGTSQKIHWKGKFEKMMKTD